MLVAVFGRLKQVGEEARPALQEGGDITLRLEWQGVHEETGDPEIGIPVS
ncbi:hypothetical protein [Parafrankia discariae]|nr:hypothetical protein [Parafrankia discariae]